MKGDFLKKYNIVIIGAGPAGIFTAIEYSKLNPESNVLIIDRGLEISKRTCPARKTGKCVDCKPCAIVSGWSGAGAFSDGKLTQSPEVGGRILDYLPFNKAEELIKYVDDYYLMFGAAKNLHGGNEEQVQRIKHEAQKNGIKLIPSQVRHLGTEKAFNVLGAMYDYLADNTNTHFMSLTDVREIIIEDNTAVGVIVDTKKEKGLEIYADYVVAAPGRAGADWMTKEAKRIGINTYNNEVDIGVRVEVPNSVIKHLTDELYEAKLVYYSDTFENKVRTFCMNPGGVVSEEHYDNQMAVVNGHSYADTKMKTDNTNFAMLVSTKFTHPFNQPIEYGRYIAKLANMLTGGGIMVQRLGDLLLGRRTDESRLKKSFTVPTLKSAVPGDLSYVLPQRYLTSIVETLKAMDKIAPGLYDKNTLLYGVEVKFYSSKIDIKDNFETAVNNLYAIGDGAGLTRGLMQASVTGVMAARDIAKSLGGK